MKLGFPVFRQGGGERRICDNKNQHLRFLEYQTAEDKALANTSKKESLGDSYTLVYYGSLAMLAQVQRHRTLRYSMYLRDPGEFGYYAPPIISAAPVGVEQEWLDDLKSVSCCFPQGTIVRITEQGIFEDFVLKCKERMCGRAQLEIMRTTAESVSRFAASAEKGMLCPTNVSLLEGILDSKESKNPCARCRYPDFQCTEGCQWKATEALSRLA